MPPIATVLPLLLTLAGVALGDSAFRWPIAPASGNPGVAEASQELLAQYATEENTAADWGGRLTPSYQNSTPVRASHETLTEPVPPVRTSDATSPATGETPIPLPPYGGSNRKGNGVGGGRSEGFTSVVSVVGSLALVLGLFFVSAWIMRRTVPGGTVLLPAEVVEVLGRAPLAGRDQVHLLRCGSKLLLVSISQAGVETLTEITDADEVNHLAGICRQSHPASATAAFQQVFQQFARTETVLEFPTGTNQDVDRATHGIAGRGRGSLEGNDV